MASAVALAALLESVRSGSLSDSAFFDETPKENLYAIKPHAGAEAAEPGVQPPSPDRPASEKQRDLTAALADLLLNAAAVKFIEPIPEVQSEVENASETDR